MIIKTCTLTRLNRKADRSVSLSFVTMTEQSTKEMADLDAMHQQDCILAIKPAENQFNDSEMRDLDSIDVDLYDNNKSQSKRIRNVLWRLHEQELGRKPTQEEFKEYYRIKTEQIIEHFKNKLD